MRRRYADTRASMLYAMRARGTRLIFTIRRITQRIAQHL